MNEQQRVQAEADAVAIAERIKADLLRVMERYLEAMPETPKFARYAVLEAARAMMVMVLRHVLTEDDDRDTAHAICVAAVCTLDAIVTPTRLH